MYQSKSWVGALACLMIVVPSCGADSGGGDGDGGTSADARPGDPDAAAPAPDANEEPFSFFVTSLQTLRDQSGSQDGFGGDFGGLAGADAICQTAAASVGFGHRTWRAFLSATTDGNGGGAVNAIDRIGDGPWYDRNGRLIAMNRAGLLATRPMGDAQAVADMTDEFGQPLSILGDSHDVITASNSSGELASTDPASTCSDWTSAVGPGTENRVMCGHSFPRSNNSGRNWLSDHPLRGCSPGVNLIQNGPGTGDCVGCSGGYGAIYCFAAD
jgi:hypothetical protein